MGQQVRGAALWVGALLGLSLLLSVLWSLAGDAPLHITLFAETPWYQQAKSQEQTLEGVLEKRSSAMASSGRWNPVQLITTQQTKYEIYLGSSIDLLDSFIGKRVRIEGKLINVLEQWELWPARITSLEN